MRSALPEFSQLPSPLGEKVLPPAQPAEPEWKPYPPNPAMETNSRGQLRTKPVVEGFAPALFSAVMIGEPVHEFVLPLDQNTWFAPPTVAAVPRSHAEPLHQMGATSVVSRYISPVAGEPGRAPVAPAEGVVRAARSARCVV